LLRSVLFCL